MRLATLARLCFVSLTLALSLAFTVPQAGCASGKDGAGSSGGGFLANVFGPRDPGEADRLKQAGGAVGGAAGAIAGGPAGAVAGNQIGQWVGAGLGALLVGIFGVKAAKANTDAAAAKAKSDGQDAGWADALAHIGTLSIGANGAPAVGVAGKPPG